jgi:hypothetical protein
VQIRLSFNSRRGVLSSWYLNCLQFLSIKKFIPWIERLLKTPIPDHRKYCIWRILAPYLINVKDLSFEEAFDVIDKWLCKCNDIEKLDFDTETKVNDYLKSAVDISYLPISLDTPDKEPKTLKTDNREFTIYWQ